MTKKKSNRAPRLRDADLTVSLSEQAYKKQLPKLQRRLSLIQQAFLFSGQSAVIVFEGWDAAGKGSAIRRISAAMDPRSFKVWPIGPPRNYYVQRHFLLRFMERLPPKGAITVFDRSWYGRVLVERIEKLTPEESWKVAYEEINHFEEMISNTGCRLIKFFLHISQEEQLARFEERLRNPLKRWKLSYEDFRNREHWDGYTTAIDEMFARTSTKTSPWHLIPANNKKFARIETMKTIANRLERGTEMAPPALDELTLKQARAHLSSVDSLIDSLAGRTE
jgi:polyphosphate kinase 2 (PPK2 family)